MMGVVLEGVENQSRCARNMLYAAVTGSIGTTGVMRVDITNRAAITLVQPPDKLSTMTTGIK